MCKLTDREITELVTNSGCKKTRWYPALHVKVLAVLPGREQDAPRATNLTRHCTGRDIHLLHCFFSHRAAKNLPTRRRAALSELQEWRWSTTPSSGVLSTGQTWSRWQRYRGGHKHDQRAGPPLLSEKLKEFGLFNLEKCCETVHSPAVSRERLQRDFPALKICS